MKRCRAFSFEKGEAISWASLGFRSPRNPVQNSPAAIEVGNPQNQAFLAAVCSFGQSRSPVAEPRRFNSPCREPVAQPRHPVLQSRESVVPGRAFYRWRSLLIVRGLEPVEQSRHPTVGRRKPVPALREPARAAGSPVPEPRRRIFETRVPYKPLLPPNQHRRMLS